MYRISLGSCSMLLVVLFALGNNRISVGQTGHVVVDDGYGPYRYHSSTAGEGSARGMADVIRSYGENNLANARAQREWEAARREFIENRVLATQAFYERREMYNQYRAAKQYEEREKANAWLAKIRLEDLSPQEFDVETGRILWPSLLADERFHNFRTQVTALFAKRSQYGELDVDDYAKAELLIKQWRAVLTSHREQIPDAMLRDSLRFLLRLNRELEHNYG